MTPCLFVSDLHGHGDRYAKLFGIIERERPAAVFLGGDLLPSMLESVNAPDSQANDFLRAIVAPGLDQLRARLGDSYPKVFIILGNDDGADEEETVLALEANGLWRYAHDRRIGFGRFTVYGYSFVPPTPFMLKDWEKYDVSVYVDPGCIPPEEGVHSRPAQERDIRMTSIQKDLQLLGGEGDMSSAIFLFHTPPYKTNLDRAALDGKKIDHVALDVNVGSIAVRRFIESRQPMLTLHGHVHESARITGDWKDAIGKTFSFSAAHDGPELALIRFDPDFPANASRELC